MALLFDDAASEFLGHGSPGVFAAPMTLAGWFNQENLTDTCAIISICDEDVDDEVFMLRTRGSIDDTVGAFTRHGLAIVEATTTDTFTANTWHHACAVFAAADDRRAFLDGANKGTESTSVVPIDIDALDIGRVGDSTPGAYMDGMIGEVGVWDVALSDAEVALLAAGYAPFLVRPTALVFYYPLRTILERRPVVGPTYLATTSSPSTGTSHPPVIYGASPTIGFPPTTVVYLTPTVGLIWLYTAANWETRAWYFEATLKSADGGMNYAKLYDLTASADVANSTVTTCSTSRARVRSSAITLTDGHEYEARFGFPGAGGGRGYGARLIGVQ